MVCNGFNQNYKIWYYHEENTSRPSEPTSRDSGMFNYEVYERGNQMEEMVHNLFGGAIPDEGNVNPMSQKTVDNHNTPAGTF